MIHQILESLKFAYRALKSNILRTILSLLGVTIGIFSIISVFTLVDSLEKGIKNNLNFLGSDVIYIERWPWDFVQNRDYPWWKYWQRPKASYEEYLFLKKYVKNGSAVAVSRASRNTVLEYKANNIQDAGFQGVSEDFDKIAEIQIGEGRYFTALELQNGKDAIILGHEVAETLFGSQNPLGKVIKKNGKKFVVIAVMKKQGNSLSMGGATPDKNCFVPLKSFDKLYNNLKDGPEPRIAIKGLPTDEGLVELEAELKGLMRRARALKPKEENDFALNRPEMFTGAIEGIFSILTIAGWFIGGFSILVGGFGIANIMFVSVKERTNLIGIEKALGAKNYFILFEFLFESTILSLIGGIAGILLVQVLALGASSFIEMNLTIENILVGLLVSTLVGVISGFAPAYSASRMDPVTAMRQK